MKKEQDKNEYLAPKSPHPDLNRGPFDDYTGCFSSTVIRHSRTTSTVERSSH